MVARRPARTQVRRGGLACRAMSDDGIGVLQAGVADTVKADFPGLRLYLAWVSVPQRRRSPAVVVERLKAADDRARGLAVGGLRSSPVATAYRAFARQIGLDPDAERNPLEQVAIERLEAGRLVSRGTLADALTIGMVETGVPLWAIAQETTTGWLRIDVDDSGRLVLADEEKPLVAVMAQPPPELEVVTRRRPRNGAPPATAVVYALRVGKVPPATVEEAFWHVRSAMDDGMEDPR
jgi:hypothetical protein